MPRNIYQSYKQTLAAGELASFNVYGSFLSVLTWADATDPSIIINRGQEMKIKPGMSLRIIPEQNQNDAAINANDATPGQGVDVMTFLQFRNNGASPVTLEFATSDGEIRDQRFSVSGSINTLDANSAAILGELQGPTAAGTDAADVTVGVSAVQVITSNAARHAFIIQADPTNTGKIHLGFTNAVTTTRKIVTLSAGASIMIDDYRGDIYAISDTAAQKVQASWY